MDWLNKAVSGIITQIDWNINISGCAKCANRDICQTHELYCSNAIEGILKDTHWKPTYKQGE